MLGNEEIVRELYTAAEAQGTDIEKFVSMFSNEGYMRAPFISKRHRHDNNPSPAHAR
jgi:hypothetical protein